MRSKLSRIVLAGLAILAVAGTGIWSATADEQKSDQSAGSSASKGSGITTNSLPSRRKGDGLKSLEQDLFKPFETIAPRGSLDGAFVPSSPEAPPAAPVIQSKRAKELLERRRDWVFETPEEILAAPSTEGIPNKRDKNQSDDKSQLSPVERFYDRLYNKDKKESTYKGTKREDPFELRNSGTLVDGSSADEEIDLPPGIQAAQREMRKLLAPKDRKPDTSTDIGGGMFSDVFGLHKNVPSREEIEMQKERMDRYKELVGLPVTPTLENDPLKPFRDMVGTEPKNGVLFPSMDTLGGMPQQNLFGVQSGSAGPPPNNPLLPDGAKAYTPASLAPALPKMDPPKSLPPPVTFGAPRRAF